MELTNAEHPDLPLADRRDLELGRFIHKFGMLEAVVAVVTWAAMGVSPQNGPQVTQPLFLKGTIELLKGLANARFTPELAEPIVDWLRDVERVAVRRNFVIHSGWVSSPVPADAASLGEITFQKFNMRKMSDRIGSITLSELRALTVETDELIHHGASHLLFDIAKAQGL